MRLRLQFQDHTYPFEDKLTTAEAMFIFDKSQVGVNLLMPELIKGNPYVVASLLFVLAKREKHVIQWDKLLADNILDVKILGPEDLDTDEDASEGAGGDVKPDPPKPSASGRTRRRGTSST